MKITSFATICFICLLCILPSTVSAKPFVISTDGSEITDLKTGLIWRRCSEGMVYSGGTCSGTVSSFTHEAALQQATTISSATQVLWRLPNIKELSSIADKTYASPAIDSTVFPVTPSYGYWSASPSVYNSAFAWYVWFGDGGALSLSRSNLNSVRLVRARQ
jgi:hypothetical protein